MEPQSVFAFRNLCGLQLGPQGSRKSNMALRNFTCHTKFKNSICVFIKEVSPMICIGTLEINLLRSASPKCRAKLVWLYALTNCSGFTTLLPLSYQICFEIFSKQFSTRRINLSITCQHRRFPHLSFAGWKVLYFNSNYRKVSNTRRTKFQNISDSRTVLHVVFAQSIEVMY